MSIFDKIYEDITPGMVEGLKFLVCLTVCVILIIAYPLWGFPYWLIKRRKKKEAEQ